MISKRSTNGQSGDKKRKAALPFLQTVSYHTKSHRSVRGWAPLRGGASGPSNEPPHDAAEDEPELHEENPEPSAGPNNLAQSSQNIPPRISPGPAGSHPGQNILIPPGNDGPVPADLPPLNRWPRRAVRPGRKWANTMNNHTGHLCYRHSALQVLSHLPCFLNLLQTSAELCMHSNRHSFTTVCFLCKLNNLLQLMWNANTATSDHFLNRFDKWLQYSAEPAERIVEQRDVAVQRNDSDHDSPFAINPGQRFMLGETQDDAFVFLVFLLELLGKQPTMTDAVDNMFRVYRQYEWECPHCKQRNIQQQPDYNIGLMVPSWTQRPGFAESLNWVCFDPQEYHNLCATPECAPHGEQATPMELRFVKLPQVLLILYEPPRVVRDGRLIKTPYLTLNDYPFELDLAGWVSPSFVGETRYELQSVIGHIGENTHEGHYIAQVRTASRTHPVVIFNDRERRYASRLEWLQMDLYGEQDPYVLVYVRQEAGGGQEGWEREGREEEEQELPPPARSKPAAGKGKAKAKAKPKAKAQPKKPAGKVQKAATGGKAARKTKPKPEEGEGGQRERLPRAAKQKKEKEQW